MFDLNKYRIKYRYSHSLRLFFDAMSKFGIRIAPYYTFRERISSLKTPTLSKELEHCKISFLGPEDIRAMAKIPGRKFSEADLLKRFNEGQKCLGMKKGGAIIAFNWCNFKELTFKWHRMPLGKNEAFMFDAYTLPDYRGKGIAPFLRHHFYKELEKISITRLYSYTDYFNTPAVKFKLKLGAEKEKLNLYIVLFNKWPFHFILKDYQK
ncbi:MAG: GNAT family N-acetyltransferase [Desulfobacteraceae bacterium]|nr:MAG: GNAT family N-acetyltransferase [Desulfobacteraceae bacterium]